MTYTPEHPYYPPFLHYALDVVQYALDQVHLYTRAAEQVASALQTKHNVPVDAKAVQAWINAYSEQYFQTYFVAHPATAEGDFRAITIDGTHFSTGKDPIGKKKAAGSLSATKLAGGVYLLTWWE